MTFPEYIKSNWPEIRLHYSRYVDGLWKKHGSFTSAPKLWEVPGLMRIYVPLVWSIGAGYIDVFKRTVHPSPYLHDQSRLDAEKKLIDMLNQLIKEYERSI